MPPQVSIFISELSFRGYSGVFINQLLDYAAINLPSAKDELNDDLNPEKNFSGLPSCLGFNNPNLELLIRCL